VRPVRCPPIRHDQRSGRRAARRALSLTVHWRTRCPPNPEACLWAPGGTRPFAAVHAGDARRWGARSRCALPRGARRRASPRTRGRDRRRLVRRAGRLARHRALGAHHAHDGADEDVRSF
jgi:hypothetical protein